MPTTKIWRKRHWKTARAAVACLMAFVMLFYGVPTQAIAEAVSGSTASKSVAAQSQDASAKADAKTAGKGDSAKDAGASASADASANANANASAKADATQDTGAASAAVGATQDAATDAPAKTDASAASQASAGNAASEAKQDETSGTENVSRGGVLGDEVTPAGTAATPDDAANTATAANAAATANAATATPDDASTPSTDAAANTQEAQDPENANTPEDTAKAQESPAFDQTQTVDTVKVTLKAEAGVYPAGATLQVKKADAAAQAKADTAVTQARDASRQVATSTVYIINVVDEDGATLDLAEGQKAKLTFEADEVADADLTAEVYSVTGEKTPKAEPLKVKADGKKATVEAKELGLVDVVFSQEAQEAEADAAEPAMPAFEQSQEVDGVVVSVQADEGTFPEGSTLQVKTVSAAVEAKVSDAVDEVRDTTREVAASYTFDIKVLDANGEEIQPADDSHVHVSFKTQEVTEELLTAEVYHVEDVANPEPEALEVFEDGDVVVAESDGFSTFVVNFTYEGLTYNLPAGTDSITLDNIMDTVGLNGKVRKVYSNPASALTVNPSGSVSGGADPSAFTITPSEDLTNCSMVIELQGRPTYYVSVTKSGESASHEIILRHMDGNPVSADNPPRHNELLEVYVTGYSVSDLNQAKYTYTSNYNLFYALDKPSTAGKSGNIDGTQLKNGIQTLADSKRYIAIALNSEANSSYGRSITVEVEFSDGFSLNKKFTYDWGPANLAKDVNDVARAIPPIVFYKNDETKTKNIKKLIADAGIIHFNCTYVTMKGLTSEGLQYVTLLEGTKNTYYGGGTPGEYRLEFQLENGTCAYHNCTNSSAVANFEVYVLDNAEASITGNTLTLSHLNEWCSYTIKRDGVEIGTYTYSQLADLGNKIEGLSAGTYSVEEVITDINFLSSDDAIPRPVSFPAGDNEVTHSHSWSYSANESTIKAKCANTDSNCPTAGGVEIDLTISAPENLAYDGTAKVASISEWTDELKEVFGETAPDIEYYSGDTKLDAAPTAVGSYTAKITVEGVTAEVTFQITKANNPDAASAPAPTAATGLSYTGNAQTLVSAPTPPDGYTDIEYSLDGGTTWISELPTGTDAGDYSITYKYTGHPNYNDITGGPITATIAKADITPSVSIDGWTYGESANDPSTSDNPGGGAVTYEYKLASADDDAYSTTVPTGAGTYVVRATVAATGNYNSGTATKEFSISPATLSVDDIGDEHKPTAAENLSYTGSPQNLATTPTAPTGYEIQYRQADGTWSTAIPQQTNANEDGYTVEYRYAAADSNHTTLEDASFKLTVPIAKVDADVTTPPAAKAGLVWNGSDLELVSAGTTTDGEIQYCATTEKLGEDATVDSVSDWSAALPTGKAATTYYVYYYVKSDDNHNDSALLGPVEVTIGKAGKLDGEPTDSQKPTANAGLAYNGGEQALMTDPSTLPSGYDQVQYSTDGESWSDSIPTGTDQGDYTVYVKYVGDSNHDDFELDDPFTVTIAKLAIEITAQDQTITYGGSIDQSKYSVATLATGDDVNALTLTPSTSSATNGTPGTITPKSATIKRGDKDVTSNYAITYKNGSLVINKAAFDGELTDEQAPKAVSDLTYNGNGQELVSAPTEAAPTGYTVKYRIKAAEGETEAEWSADLPEATNAGDYVIEVLYEGDSDHTDFRGGDIPVKIKKKAVTVTPKPEVSTKVYGKDDPASFTYDADGLVGSDTLGGSITRAEGENVGEYEFDVSDLANSNYEISLADDAKFKITPSSLDTTNLADNQKPTAEDVTYNKEAQQLVADPEGALPEGYSDIHYLLQKKNADTGEWEPVGDYGEAIPKAKDEGTYRVAYKYVAADDNHSDVIAPDSDWLEITIKPKDITITYDLAGGEPALSAVPAQTDHKATLSDGSDFARDGYTFAGWKDANGTEYAAGTEFNVDSLENFTVIAQWTENDPVSIKYSAENKFDEEDAQHHPMGAVAVLNDANKSAEVIDSAYVAEFTESDLKPATGQAVGAIAKAHGGYHFYRWILHREGQEDKVVSEEAELKPEPVYHDGDWYEAWFVEDADVTITYKTHDAAQGLVKLGSADAVEETSETLHPATGTSAGVKAVPNDGYYFVAWEHPVNGVDTAISTNVSMVPPEDDFAYKPDTYIAYFAPISGEGSSISASVAGDEEETIVYDGTEQKPAITVTNADLPEGAQTLVKGKDYEVSYTNNVDAGTATATITFKSDRYKGSFTKEFTIQKRPITLTSATASKDYDGTALEDDGITVGGKGYVTGQEFTYNFTGSQTVVGESSNTFSIADNTAKQANYKVTITPGTLTVNALSDENKLVGEVTGKSESKVFTGSEQTLEGLVSDSFTYNGKIFKVNGLSAVAKATNVGDAGATVFGDTFTITDENAYDVTDQFKLTKTAGKLTITAKPIDKDGTVTPEDGSDDITVSGAKPATSAEPSAEAGTEATYTGKPFEPKFNVKMGDTALVYGQDYEVVWNDDIDAIDAGDYTAKIVFKGNYSGEIAGVKFKVAKAALTVTAPTLSKKYGAADPTDDQVNAVTYDGLQNGETTAADLAFTISREAGEAVGDYPYNFEKTADAKNYDVTFVPGKLTIESVSPDDPTGSGKKVDVVNPETGETEQVDETAVTVTSDAAAYTGQKPTITVTDNLAKNAAGEAESADVPESQYEITWPEDATDAGIHTVTVTFTDGNYKGSTKSFTYVIAPREITVSTPSKSQVYDGTPLTHDEGAAIAGLQNGETATLKVAGTATNVADTADNNNTYVIVWDGTAKESNYKDATDRATLGTLTITKSPVALKSANFERSYNGKALTNAETDSVKDYVAETQIAAGATEVKGQFGFAEGEGAKITFTGSQRKVGSSPNSFSYELLEGTDANNYEIAEVTESSFGTLNVMELDADSKFKIAVTAGSGSATYDGKDHTVEPPVATFVYDGTTYTATGESAGDNGEKKFTFTIGDETYVITGISTTDPVASTQGTYNNNATGTMKVTDGDGNDVTGEFVFSPTQGSLEISKAAINDDGVLVDSTGEPIPGEDGKDQKVVDASVPGVDGSGTFVYDGTEHAPVVKDTTTDPAGTLTRGTDYTVAYYVVDDEGNPTSTEVSPTDAGKKAVVITFTDTSNFSGSITQVIEIAKRPITLKSDDASKIYDGTALTANGQENVKDASEGAGAGFVSGQGFVYDITGTQTSRGESDNEFTVTGAQSGTSMDNYETPVLQFGKLTVTKAKVSDDGNGGGILTDEDGNPVDKDGKPLPAGADPVKVVSTKGSDGDTAPVYDATDHKPTIYDETVKDAEGNPKQLAEGTDYTVEYYFVGEDGKPDTSKPTTADAAGDKVAVITLIGDYEGTLNVPVDVAYRPVTFTGDDATKTYTGKEQSISTWTDDSAEEGKGLVSGHTTVKDGADSVAYVAKGTKAGDHTADGFTPKVEGVEDGTSSVTIAAAEDVKIYDADGNDATANYTVATATGKLIIKPAKPTDPATDAEGNPKTDENGDPVPMVSASESEGETAPTYDGTDHKPVVTDNATDPAHNLVEGTDYTVAYYPVKEDGTPDYDNPITGEDAAKDAGEKVAVITFIGDYASEDPDAPNTIEVRADVAKRAVTLTSDDADKKYDGNELVANQQENVKVSGDGFVNGQGATYSITGTQTVVGTSDNAFTYTLNNGTKAPNYDITTVAGTLEVKALSDDEKLSIAVVANSDTVVYDGKPHTVQGFQTLEFTVNGQKFTVEGLNASVTGQAAGDYTSEIEGTPIVRDAKGNDVTAQFKVNTEGSGTLTIKQAQVSDDGNGKAVLTDGEGNPVDKDGNKLTRNDDGTYSDADGNPAEPVVVASVADPDEGNPPVYDGKPHKPKVVDETTGEELVEGTDYHIVWTDADGNEIPDPDGAVNAGDKVATVVFDKDIKGEVKVDMPVAKRPVTFTGTDQTTTYTGKKQSFDAFTDDQGEGTGLVSGHESNVAYTAEGTMAGEHTADGFTPKASGVTDNTHKVEITVAADVVIKDGSKDVTANYTVATATGKLTIKQAQVSDDGNGNGILTDEDGDPIDENGNKLPEGADPVKVISSEGSDGDSAPTYDGKPHAPKLTDNTVKDDDGNAKELVEGTDYDVAYYAPEDVNPDGTVKDGAKPLTADEAGDKVAVVTLKGDYTGTLVVPVDVAKRPVTFTGETATKKYSGAEQGITGITPTTAADDNAEGLLSGHAASNLAYSATGTAKGVYDGAFTPADAADVVIKDGSADVTKNYEVTLEPGKLTIEQTSVDADNDGKPDTLKDADGNDVTDENGKPVPVVELSGTDGDTAPTYDDAEHKPVVVDNSYVDPATGKRTPKTLEEGTDYTVAYYEAKADGTPDYDKPITGDDASKVAGDKVAVITFTGDYSGELTVPVDVKKRTVEFAAKDGTFTYNGKKQAQPETDFADNAGEDTGLVSGHSSNVAYTAEGTKAGTHTENGFAPKVDGVTDGTSRIAITPAADVKITRDSDSADVTANYDITTVTATLTITAAGTTDDGNGKAVLTDGEGNPVDKDGNKLTRNDDGTYSDADGNPAEPVVVASVADPDEGNPPVYDGKPHKPKVVDETTGKELVEGTDYHIVWTDADGNEIPDPDGAVNAGDKVATVVFDNDIAGSVKVKMPVAKRPVAFTGETATKVYNGAEQELTSVSDNSSEEGKGLLPGHSSNAAYSAKGTAKGSYDGTITAADKVAIKNGDADVTANYDVTTVAGTLTIKAAKVSDDGTGTGNGILTDEDGNPIDKDGNKLPAGADPVKVISAEGADGDDAPTYDGKPHAPVIYDNASKDADGNPKKLVEGTDYDVAYYAPEDVNPDGTVKDGAKPLTADEAGDKVAVVTLKGDYEGTVVVPADVKKADPSVTKPKAANGLTYNGAGQQLLDPLPSSPDGTVMYQVDGGEWTTEPPTATEAGEHTVAYKVVGDSNHNDSEPVTLKVNIAQAGGTLTDDNKPTAKESLEYNGNDQPLVEAPKTLPDGCEKVQYRVSTDGGKTWSDLSDDIPTGRDAGNYLVKTSYVMDSNHAPIDPVTTPATIGPRQVDEKGGVAPLTDSDGNVVDANGNPLTKKGDGYVDANGNPAEPAPSVMLVGTDVDNPDNIQGRLNGVPAGDDSVNPVLPVYDATPHEPRAYDNAVLDAAGVPAELAQGEDFTVKYYAPEDVNPDGTVKPGAKPLNTTNPDADDYAFDAGEVVAVVEFMGNHAGTLTAPMKIAKREFHVVTADDSKRFDGTPLTAPEPQVWVTGGTYDNGDGYEEAVPAGTGLVNGQTVEVTVTGSQTGKGSSENTYEIRFKGEDAATENAEPVSSLNTQSNPMAAAASILGTQTAWADALTGLTENGQEPTAKRKNYTEFAQLGTLTVQAKSAQGNTGIAGADDNKDIKVNPIPTGANSGPDAAGNSGATYTGGPIAAPELYDTSILDANGNPKKLVEGTDYDVAYYAAEDIDPATGLPKPGAKPLPGAPSDAGDYYMVVTYKGDYEGTYSTKVSIAQAELTVKTPSAEKEYDGKALTATQGDDLKLEGLLPGETATLVATGSQTQVGESTNTYAIEWGTAKEGNYKVVKEDLGTLKVTEAKAVEKKPTAKGGNTTSGKATSTAKTGDEAPLSALLATMMASMMAIVVAGWRRRREDVRVRIRK